MLPLVARHGQLSSAAESIAITEGEAGDGTGNEADSSPLIDDVHLWIEFALSYDFTVAVSAE